MCGSASRPIVVDVVAQLLNEFWNQVCAGRFVFATRDYDIAWPPVACKSVESIDGETIELQDPRRSQAKLSVILRGPVLNHFDQARRLHESVWRFPLCTF